MRRQAKVDRYSGMSLKEISKAYTKLRDIAHKRIARVAKAGLTDFSSLPIEPKKIKDFSKDPTAREKELKLATRELEKVLKYGDTKLGDIQKKIARMKKELEKKRKESFEKKRSQMQAQKMPKGKFKIAKIEKPKEITIDDLRTYKNAVGRIWSLAESLSLPSDVTYTAIEDAGFPPDIDQLFDDLKAYLEEEDEKGRTELEALRKDITAGSF